MNKSSLLLVLAALMSVAHLSAEDILLKDGTKITGRLAGITGDVFEVKTAYGDIKIPRSDVVNIAFPENAAKGTENGVSLPPVDEDLKGESYTNRTAAFQAHVPSGWKLAPELRKSKDVIAALESSDETQFFMVTPENFLARWQHIRPLQKVNSRATSANTRKKAKLTPS